MRMIWLSACRSAARAKQCLSYPKKVSESENVEELDPAGQLFDASVAEAIMAVPPEEGEESGIVKQVYVKGYKRGDKVLRYAQVVVTQ